VAHASIDYAAAIVFGSLMYWLAVRTKSLAACVLAHAVANLILGVYVMVTQQWGYW
jgi:membrane protease YdiL (CAAX protease family)